MDGSAFRVRGDTCTRVTTEISALKLHKNEDVGYAYDDALDLFFEDKRVVVRISAIFVLVKLECQDISRDSGASVSADAEADPYMVEGFQVRYLTRY